MGAPARPSKIGRRARVRRAGLIAATCAATLNLATPAYAWQPPRVTRMTLAIQLTGIHVLDWHLQDSAYPDPARAWVTGSGTQTLGFSTPRPILLRASAISGTTPSGERLPPVVLSRVSAPRALKGSLRRVASWRHNDEETCDREGGCMDGQLVPMPHQQPSCPARKLGVPVDIDVVSPTGHPADDGLFALFRWTGSFDDMWSRCPPDIDGVKRPLTLAQPARLEFAHGIERISRLRLGATLKLKAQLTRGARDGLVSDGCPALAGPGQQECAVTDLTLEIKRIR